MHEPREAIIGFIASHPRLTTTRAGIPRVHIKVGHRPNTGPPTVFGDLVQYGQAAQRTYESFRKGDRFIAAGHRRRGVFIATAIGHDTAHTTYTVNRTAPRPTRRVPTQDAPRLINRDR